jgi:DNA-directed RNA polymerase subunit omega
MARIITRDCERVVPNRYELVLLAAELARELPQEHALRPDREGGAATVTALRRIAAGEADPESLRANLWRRGRNLPFLGEGAGGDNTLPLHREAQAA